MPEWNLVVAQESDRALKTSSTMALPKLPHGSVVACCLFLAAFVLTQLGCSKIRSGGLDRNILRSSDTVPSQEARPSAQNSKTRFANDPTKALLELNEVYEEVEGKPFEETSSNKTDLDDVFNGSNPSQSQLNDARIIDISQQSLETQEKGITLVAIQPPAPSIKNSFEASKAVSASNDVNRVLLGGVPLLEIEPLNPAKAKEKAKAKAKALALCEHIDCDCMKEKLKPALPFARPVEPPPFTPQAPPSELVSQPLAPIMFDETTREVQTYGQEQAKQNRLRLIEQPLVENSAPLKEKLETQVVLEPNEPSEFTKAEPRPIHFHPTVDPELGRTVKLPPSCKQCDSFQCVGDCSKRRPDNIQLRPVVASEEIPTFEPPQVVGTAIAEPVQRTPIAIQGEFVPAPEVTSVAKVDYLEFTTEDWTEIFGPPEVPIRPTVEAKNRRAELPQKLPVVPPSFEREVVAAPNVFSTDQRNQFQPAVSNDFSPINQDNVELVVAEVVAENAIEGAQWEPPKHTNFSPIPTSDSGPPKFAGAASLALEKAAKRGANTPFPVVDTRVEIPVKPEVIVEIVDNTVPWSVKLAETIDNVRRQRDAQSDPMTRNGIEVNLRLLEVLQRQMETVEENKHSMPNRELQYWQHQLDAITVMLPATNNGVSDLDRHNTAYETLEHLRKAVERLESIAELKVSSGRFCTEISGFGKYKPFASSIFKSGQKTLVYCEVENYLSSARVINSEPSYLTRLRGSYVIYDQQGRVVQQSEYPVVEDVARKRRRDFYMYFPIQIGKLAAGNYKLELMVEDLGSNKTAALKPGMQFKVQ